MSKPSGSCRRSRAAELSRRPVAIEVKRGRTRDMPAGMAAFTGAFKPERTLPFGGDGITVEEFVARPVTCWIEQ